jgi:poly(A) polymerase
MPIITPVYPTACVSYTVTHSTKRIILRELDRAARIADEIALGRNTWGSLFEKHTFFTRDYRNYLGIVVASRDEDAQRQWAGRIQANSHWLGSGIDHHLETGSGLACLYNYGFDRVYSCKNEKEADMVFQGSLQANQLGNLNSDSTTDNSELTDDIRNEGEHAIYTTTYYVGLDVGNPGGECFPS